MKANTTDEQVARLKAARDAIAAALPACRKAKADEDAAQQDFEAAKAELQTLAGTFRPDDTDTSERWFALKLKCEILANYCDSNRASDRAHARTGVLTGAVKAAVDPFLAVLADSEKTNVVDPGTGYFIPSIYGSWANSRRLAQVPAECAAQAIAEIDGTLAVRVQPGRGRPQPQPQNWGSTAEETAAAALRGYR
jgi:hypothetical protein